MNNTYLKNLAAVTNGNITELADSLTQNPANDQLHADLPRVAEAIDKKFGLRTIVCPVESAA